MEQENGLLGAVAAMGGTVGRAIGEVFAAEKQLSDTMASGPGSSQKFDVTKETVLQAGKIIQDQAGRLRTALEDAVILLGVQLNDPDEVNADIAAAWNSRLIDGPESYAGRIEQYITSLNGLVEQLRGAARQYEYTEDEVNAALGAVRASD
ncbi:hypothetical protein [Saccharothrix deserti]|uniref:hypothetical protein n=1 Tax=Saccharothrix deserti TaxID=2593674 RepID=UPI00131B7C4D|nr:hypothetical protein [Saccharothrix deserti]